MPATENYSLSRGVTDRTLLVWFFVAIAFILLVTGGALLNRSVWSKRAEAKIAQMAEAGYPVSMEDLKRRHQEAIPENNAADIYEKAFAATRKRTTNFDQDLLPLFGRAELPEPGDPLPMEMAEEIRRFLEQNSEAIDHFLAASQMAECRFSPAFGSEEAFFMEYVGSFRDGARLLSLKAMLEANEGRTVEAAETVGAIFRMSDHLREDPFLIPALTRVAIAGMGVANLPWVLNGDECPEEALVRLQETIAASEDEFILAKFLPAEIVWGIYYARTGVFEEMGKPGDWEEFQEFAFLGAYRAAGQMERDLVYYLAGMEELVERARLPLAERTRSSSTSRTPTTWRHFFSGMVFLDEAIPTFERFLKMEKNAVATVRAGVVGVAASRYRLRHGAYPKEISKLPGEGLLEPAQIVDPFTGDPLDYALEEGGFAVTVEGKVVLRVNRRAEK